MKRILFSLGVITFVGALAWGATGAFFSDTETSTGNTFTAGAIDLKVDSQAHYAGLECINGVWADDVDVVAPTTRPDLVGQACSGTWTETDLGPTNQFFSLSDLKPGDSGENTLSLHVLNNDAYVCAIVNNLVDNENDITEPEADLSDTAPTGELSGELNFFAWADNGGVTPGDNIWQEGEPALFSNTTGPASDVLGGKSYALFTPATVALPATETTYLGLYWCYGDITVGPGNALSCSGTSVTNSSQTDSITADISFYVEQSRNNANFTCPTPEGVDPDGDNGDVVVNADDLYLTNDLGRATSPKWLFYNDTNDTVMTINQFSGTGGVNDIVAGPLAVGAAQMTLDTGVNPRYNIATYKYKNVKLSDIGSLKYRIYDASVSAQTPFLNFNIDFNNSDTWQSRLVQVPTGVAVNTWTTVDALAGSWTYSGATWPAPIGGAGTTAHTWAEILAAYPNAETRSTDSFLGVRVGHPGPNGEVSYVDWVEFDGETTDFEI